MSHPIEIRNLRVVYPASGRGVPAKTAVTGLDLEIHPGEIFGLLGPNGAGKTTTMNVLLGFVNATEGDARIFGRTARDPQARQQIGYDRFSSEVIFILSLMLLIVVHIGHVLAGGLHFSKPGKGVLRETQPGSAPQVPPQEPGPPPTKPDLAPLAITEVSANEKLAYLVKQPGDKPVS